MGQALERLQGLLNKEVQPAVSTSAVSPTLPDGVPVSGTSLADTLPDVAAVPIPDEFVIQKFEGDDLDSEKDRELDDDAELVLADDLSVVDEVVLAQAQLQLAAAPASTTDFIKTMTAYLALARSKDMRDRPAMHTNKYWNALPSDAYRALMAHCARSANFSVEKADEVWGKLPFAYRTLLN